LNGYLTSGVYLTNKKAQSILCLLEIRNFDYVQNTLSFNKNLSLEHIYPQTPKEGEIELVTEDKDSIGNMMLFNLRKNISVSNKSFAEKLEIYNNDNTGYLKTSQYVLEQANKEKPIWLDKQIEENAEYILGLIKTTWINKA
jgi:hypothetical protein